MNPIREAWTCANSESSSDVVVLGGLFFCCCCCFYPLLHSMLMNKSSSSSFIIFLLLFFHSASTLSRSQRFHEYTPNPHLFSAEKPLREGPNRLSKPLIRDARVYACSHNILYAFESNGTIIWSFKLNYTCNAKFAPIHGGFTTLYLVAENRVLRINPLHFGTSEPAVDVVFGPQPGAMEDQVIGIAVSTLSSSLFVNVKYKGLFAYRFHGELIWTAGPVLYRNGYRQGCAKNWNDCYFASAPVIDQCEASIYVANQEGELYALSTRRPYFKWVQDLSSFDKNFTVTPGNNGILYVTVPVKTLILALDATTGTVLWQRIIGPLSAADSAAIVDSNGWLSIGSLDGFLYSLSPTGDVKKFSGAVAAVKSVVQVSPLVDCSGYAVYVSHTEVEGKVSQSIGEYTYTSALKPTRALFNLLVPATGSIYWSDSYPGQFSPVPSDSDLQRFILDEEILLAFVAASKIGNPLPCRSTRQKLSSSCSQAEPKHVTVYTASEKAILLFLLFESALLVALVVAVRFCCIFWKKKKVQDQDLGKFLQKRRSLQLKKKAFNRTITELEQKAAEEEEETRNQALERLGDMMKENEGIERKLSTTYSLGRDRTGPSSSTSTSKSKSLLPLYNRKTKSFSFQGSKKESVTIFHTLSDDTSSSSSADTSSSREELEEAASRLFEDKGSAVKAKGKAVIEVSSSSEGYDFSDEDSDDESGGYYSSPSEKAFTDGLKQMKMDDDDDEGVRDTPLVSSRSIRRRTLSSRI